MTREEAIWRLENCLDCTDCFTCGTHDNALELAIAALREHSRLAHSEYPDYYLEVLTMKEYIEREALLARMPDLTTRCGCYFDARTIAHAPAADVVERKRGRWVMTLYTTISKRNRVISNKKFACSECGYGNGRKQTNFCPNCGADMREVDHD